MVDAVPGEHEHAAAVLLAPHKHGAICAAAEQRAAGQMDAYDSAAVPAQRLHTRVLGVGVPRREHVDAAVRAPAGAALAAEETRGNSGEIT